jgi:hypothetical protein
VDPGEPGHVAEYPVVRTRQSVQQVQHGQPDRHQHPVQHPDSQHRDGGHRGDHGLAPAAIRRNPPMSIRRSAAKITTAPSAARGKPGQHPSPGDQHDDDQPERDQ